MHTRDRSGAPSLSRRWIVPVVSLLFTFFFFHEYFARRVYIPFDLPSFHDPLADYAFVAIRHGRFPEWDPSNYGGMPFAANPQAALFYPGTWLMFAANWHRQHLSYYTLEVFVLVHLWIAWMLSFAWMRGRRLGVFASACGAGIFAFSGYLMMELQHLGLVVGYAWIPLGLMGIDEAAEKNSWRPLWKVVAASALAFLGGYTPTWFVVAMCFVAYAASRRGGGKWGLRVCGALAASLGLVMIQLLPAMQLSSLRQAELRYGLGLRDPAFYISCFIPNFYDFGPHVNVLANPGREYLYLGAPAFIGLALLPLFRRPAKEWSAIPLVGMFMVCAVIVTDPFGIVSYLVLRSTLLGQVCRAYYFLTGLVAAAAPLAAIGIDRFLAKKSGSTTGSFPVLAAMTIAGLAAFSGRLLYVWTKSDFAPGWAGAWDVAILTILFAAGLWLLRDRKGPLGIALAGMLLVTAGVDYKVHGTNKRFNATPDHSWRTDWMPGMNSDVYRTLQANSVYRLALDQTGPLAADMRHFGLTTPEGFDPFLTTAFHKYIETAGRFLTNWIFEVDPDNASGLHTLGIGYFVTSTLGPQYPALKANPKLRLLQPDDSFYKVYEVIDKQPPYGVEGQRDAKIERTRWEPEHREFTVTAPNPGKFYLSEQWNPGWSAKLDGKPVPIERWNGAFQSIPIQAGEHQVDFEFRDSGLRIGAAVSLVSLLGLIAVYRLGSKRNLKL